MANKKEFELVKLPFQQSKDNIFPKDSPSQRSVRNKA